MGKGGHLFKPKSAKYIRVEHPLSYGTLSPRGREYFKSIVQERDYWEGEFDKWEHGLKGSDGEQILTGRHYFYLQEYKMYSLKSRGFIYPSWRDCDDFVFEEITKSFKTNDDIFGAKRRGYGWTSIISSVALHTAITAPGSKVPITSADDTRVKSIIKDCIMPGFSNFNSYYKPETGTENKGEVEFSKKEYEYVVRNGKEVKLTTKGGLLSRIIAKPTQINPNQFESIRAPFGVLDEAFLHPKLNEAKASMRFCFGEGIDKDGFLIMGGSAGNEEKNLEAMNLCSKIWFDKNNKVTKIFLPGWMGNADYSVNGWSDEKKAVAVIEKERERLSKMSDLTEYRNYVHSLPLTIEDVFNIQQTNFFPDEVINILNRAKTYIMKEDIHLHKGYLEPNGTGRPVFKPDVNGDVVILEHPLESDITTIKDLYIAGIDPIPFNTTNEKGSKYGMIIHKRNAETPVAYLLLRSANDIYLAEQSILMQKYFGWCQANIEKNRGEVIMKRYEDAGVFEKLLCNTPTDQDVRYVSRKRTKGEHASKQSISKWRGQLISWIIQHGTNLKLLELVEQLLAYAPEKNFDLVDAFMLCLSAHNDKMGREVKAIDTAPKVYKINSLKRIGTKMVRQTILVPVRNKA